MTGQRPTYEVEIIDTTTGERRIAQQVTPWGAGDGALFWWTEGNFGCDCNRGMEFERAGGEETTEHPCSTDAPRFRVTFARLPDGAKIAIDGEPKR